MKPLSVERVRTGSGQTITVAARSTPALPMPLGASARASPTHPCMEFVPGSGGCLTDELHCLLRRRLRIAGLIAWCGFTAVLIRNLLTQGTVHGPTPMDLALHTGVVAVLTLLGGLLWSGFRLCMPTLRTIELVMFGTMAAHFGYLQFRMFHHGALLDWAFEVGHERALALGAQTNALRWLILIVLYGTFIPNTWKRCTAVVATLVAVPLILNFFVCVGCTVMGPYTWTMAFDMAVILAVAAAIAIFGSYRINTLHAQAFEAKKLGQYVLRDKLGAGGMGEVYLGEHVLLRRACAIKLIHPEQAGDPTNLSRFEREVRAMATLTHWNTVEIYDYGRAENGTFYYVMEYLPGLSLQALVEQQGPLPAGRAIHFLRQICAALKEAHHIGLIHRDIKPSNVLVCERGGVPDVAKLLDFGLVHSVSVLGVPGLGVSGSADKLTVDGAILGSPPYMSPEQAMSKPNIDPRTDIYSLGALGYFLVTGQAPFVRESAMEHLVAHLHEPVTPPRQFRPEVPEELDEILLHCLHKKPEDRYPDIAAVDFALARCDAVSDWDAERAEKWWRQRDQRPDSERTPVLASAR